MKLFNASQLDQINKVAEKSKESLASPATSTTSRSINSELQEISKNVVEYFKDSDAILITSKHDFHDYITNVIESGYAGIDCETTGLDRIKDYIVGFSLYYPGGVECYVPNKHLIPIFEAPYKDQLTYDDVREELLRLVEAKVKLIFANADFDLAMMHKDYKVDLTTIFYYDVILAWRCLKEDEKDNRLKVLYNKYVLKGKGDPKTFSDFFPAKLFPYCKPEIAKLYAANDAKITYELFRWQLPYTDKNNSKCKKAHLESIADLIWNVEFPLVKACHELHYNGVYIDKPVANRIRNRYNKMYDYEMKKLRDMVQEIIETSDYTPTFNSKPPFTSGSDFNPNSVPQVKHLLYTVMKLPSEKASTDKEILRDMNLPITNQLLKVRSLSTLIGTFTDKLPKSVAPDGRIHAQFKQIGADTGRMSSADPNLQNIPSHAVDIRHEFRATPGYVMMSSDYSQQEPKLTAFIGDIKEMIDGFTKGQDAYAMIASVAYGVPYEQCLEFHPETHEYQPEGKTRRSEAKTILLGVLYGRSIVTIADQLFGKDKTMSDEDKMKGAQKVYDAVMNAFPGLRNLMNYSQQFARKYGYVETILGRRRHIPDMQLPEFEFKPMKGYVNPDIDPLDISTLDNRAEIPERIQDELLREFKGYKYFGQVVKATKRLTEQNIKVVNNKGKITEATRQCVNSRVQGSAADLTKLAILRLESDPEWKEIGGRFLIPVHDELICEVPMENAERGAEILSNAMCEAGSFLPFPITCDVETTMRWYGLPYPCPFEKPSSLSDTSTNAISWLQYCIVECEYLLPIYKDENGEKPKGIAARGVNGIDSEELRSCIQDYMSSYGISEYEFIDHIENNVFNGRR